MDKSLTIEQQLEVEHVAQSLFILPRRVLDLRYPISEVSKMREGQARLVQLRLKRIDYFDRYKKLITSTHKGKPVRADFLFEDRQGVEIEGSSFSPFSWKRVELGAVFYLSADLTYFRNRLQVSNPEIIPKSMVGKINPVYPAIRKKASSETVFQVTRDALEKNLDDASDYLLASAGFRADEVTNMLGVSAKEMLSAIHQPQTPQSWELAMETAKRFSIMEVLEKSERIRQRPPEKRSMLLTVPVEFNGIKITNDQKNAMEDIFADLRSGFPMRRLLSGDVGRGKTVPMVGAVASVWRAYKAQGTHRNIAILLPNENLVNQVIGQIARFFPDVECQAVVGTAKKKLAIDPSKVIIGTSAICHLKDYVADLLLVDEQHKFSREQREAIADSHTNMLEATATAIPRSIALITHGGMSVSIIRECPVVKNIKTMLVDDHVKKDMYRSMTEIVNSGDRLLIVYPLVEGSKASDAQTVEQGYHAWRGMFGDLVGMVHGKMSNEDKSAAIQSMRDGVTRVLISSSVVEVGLDIPDIKAMLIVRPQLYGLNQLHQLRGRLVRNGGDGHCYLYPEEELNEIELARLVALIETDDGFEIAEKDMELRGFGDLASDSDEQKGASSVTFRGLALMPSDFKALAESKAQQTDGQQKTRRISP